MPPEAEVPLPPVPGQKPRASDASDSIRGMVMGLMKATTAENDPVTLCKIHTMVGRQLGNYFLAHPPADYERNPASKVKWDKDAAEVERMLDDIDKEPVPTASMPYPELSDSDGSGRKRYDIKMDEVPTAVVASEDLKITMETQVGIAERGAYAVGERHLGGIWPRIQRKLMRSGLWDIDTPVRYSAPSITHDDVRRGVAEVERSTTRNRFREPAPSTDGSQNRSPMP